MNRPGQGFRKFTQSLQEYYTQTHATENLITPHLRVVISKSINTNLKKN